MLDGAAQMLGRCARQGQPTIRPWLRCAPSWRSPSRPPSSASSAELERRLAANPGDHQARFDLAMVLNAKGERGGAADQLLEIIRRDRSWNEEKARKQLLQFFEAWGPMRRGDAGRAAQVVVAAVFLTAGRLGRAGAPHWRGMKAGKLRTTVRAGDLPDEYSGVSAAGGAAAAGRPHAAQHLRAALSADDRRGARRPPADRHDPARARRRAARATASRSSARSAAPAASPPSPRPATAAT